MEIKATLNKPYTDKERADFIVINNHLQGYEIKETETALEARGKTDEETRKQTRVAELHRLLAEADYWTSKHADGEYTDEEWAEKVAIRKAWREELRELEK